MFATLKLIKKKKVYKTGDLKWKSKLSDIKVVHQKIAVAMKNEEQNSSVQRTDSQRSQTNGPRVSFNKDVHIKKIG